MHTHHKGDNLICLIKMEKVMATLFLNVDDSLLSRALLNSQEQGISLEAWVHEALKAASLSQAPDAPHKTVNVDSLISRLLEKARAVNIEGEFTLNELCDDSDWNALTSGERKSVGKAFRKALEDTHSHPPLARFVRRNSANKAIYQRI